MENTPINYYSLICSRSSTYSPTTRNLFSYLSNAGITVKSLIGQSSIFSAYEKGVNRLSSEARSNDIVIMCHDDIEIKTSPDKFKEILDGNLSDDIGFVGVAGTSKLNETGIWWDWNNPQYMSGEVLHGTEKNSHTTTFGPYKEVVALDGVFLAARYSTLLKIDLAKPGLFEGDWDFYDIYYCLQAIKLGYLNLTVPILIRHESPGDISNRPSWHKNRESLKQLFNLPVEVYEQTR